MKILTVAIIVIGAIFLVGCDGSGSDSVDVVGVWYNADTQMYRQYKDDGSCSSARTVQSLDALPAITCVYEVERDRLTVTEVEAFTKPPCGDDPGVYEVALLDNGKLNLVLVEDECTERANSMEGEYEPVP